MTTRGWTLYTYRSRSEFDLDDPYDTDRGLTRTVALQSAQSLQRRGYWVRAYFDAEYKYHLTPEGEADGN